MIETNCKFYRKQPFWINILEQPSPPNFQMFPISSPHETMNQDRGWVLSCFSVRNRNLLYMSCIQIRSRCMILKVKVLKLWVSWVSGSVRYGVLSVQASQVKQCIRKPLCNNSEITSHIFTLVTLAFYRQVVCSSKSIQWLGLHPSALMSLTLQKCF